ncbi:MAG TPA: hypothetical protein VHW26_07375 [Solirubrobacteraceae bacterium]|nr:hypothetical protein [Solirubrobacteraceae bacterium]
MPGLKAPSRPPAAPAQAAVAVAPVAASLPRVAPPPAGPVAAASAGSVLAGSVDFIDAATTSGTISLGGEASLAPDARSGDAFLPFAGILANFRVHAIPDFDEGTLTFTVMLNDVSSPVTCTIAAPATSCADLTHSAGAAAGTTIAVFVTNGTRDFVRYVRWTAAY